MIYRHIGSAAVINGIYFLKFLIIKTTVFMAKTFLELEY